MVYDAQGLVYTDRYSNTVAIGDDRICLLTLSSPADRVLMDFWRILATILIGLVATAVAQGPQLRREGPVRRDDADGGRVHLPNDAVRVRDRTRESQTGDHLRGSASDRSTDGAGLAHGVRRARGERRRVAQATEEVQAHARVRGRADEGKIA